MADRGLRAAPPTPSRLQRSLAALAALLLAVGIAAGVDAATDLGDFRQLGGDITGQPDPEFTGLAIALDDDGSRVVVGEPSAGLGEEQKQTGRVRVFDWESTTWVPVGETLLGSNHLDEFGHAVALSADGSRIVVTALALVLEDAGYVRTFDWDGTGWVAAGADIPEPEGVDEWGQSVAISADGSRLAVGASSTPNGPGRVYPYRWDGNGWAPDGPYLEGRSANDRFGASVAMTGSGEVLAIGAPGLPGRAGSARVVRRTGTGWAQVGEDLTAGRSGDFGWTVAISDQGTRLAVGAPGIGAGLVRVHDWDGVAWRRAGPDFVGAGDFGFGSSLALSGDGDRIAVADLAAVGVHDWDGAVWQRQASLDTRTPLILDPPNVALSRDALRFAVDHPRLRVFEGPEPDEPTPPPPAGPVTANTLPATGVGSAAGTGLLALALLVSGTVAATAARRRTGTR